MVEQPPAIETDPRGTDLPTIPPAMDSATAKLVYVTVTWVGESTATRLSEELGVPLLELLPVLKTLEERGLVTRDGDRVRREIDQSGRSNHTTTVT